MSAGLARLGLRPLTTTVVGSLPCAPSRAAMVASYRGGADPFIESLEASIRVQLDAGIEMVSDGQTRAGMIDLFARGLRGVRMRARPSVVAPLEWRGPITVADQLRARGLLPAGVKLKGIVTGPHTMASGVADEHYHSAERLAFAFADALNAEAQALEPHVDVVQFDEPFLSVEWPSFAIELVGRVREGIRKPVALHVCGDVAPVFGRLAEMPVDILDHEFAANPGLVAVVADHAPSQCIGLGCVRSDRPEIEKVEVIEALIRKAAGAFGEGRLMVDPDCGLRHLDAASAARKLRNMVLARDRVRRDG